MSISGTLSFKYFIGSYFLQLHTMLGNAGLLSCLFNFLTLTLFLTHVVVTPREVKTKSCDCRYTNYNYLRPFVSGDEIEELEKSGCKHGVTYQNLRRQ
jgi:hypothetical protein